MSGSSAGAQMGRMGKRRRLQGLRSLYSAAFFALAISLVFRSREVALLITVALVVHEMGHVLALLRFRVEWEVGFGPLGAWTRTPLDQRRALSHFENSLIHLAGPFASLVLALLALGVDALLKPDVVWGYWPRLANFSAAVALLNFLPLGTLSDGGKFAERLFASLVERVESRFLAMTSVVPLVTLVTVFVLRLDWARLVSLLIISTWFVLEMILESRRDDPAEAVSPKAMTLRQAVVLLAGMILALLISAGIALLTPFWLTQGQVLHMVEGLATVLIYLIFFPLSGTFGSSPALKAVLLLALLLGGFLIGRGVVRRLGRARANGMRRWGGCSPAGFKGRVGVALKRGSRAHGSMAIEGFSAVVTALLRVGLGEGVFASLASALGADPDRAGPADIARGLNAAFLAALAGERHPAYGWATDLLERMKGSTGWGEVAAFYRSGVRLIREEVQAVCQRDPGFADRLGALHAWVEGAGSLRSAEDLAERFWSVTFPEGVGIRGDRAARVEALRRKRAVVVEALNPEPITDPAREMLFTANALFTVPVTSSPIEGLPLSDGLKAKLHQAAEEPQRYWYDHPIPIGVQESGNEVLYGLRGLAETVAFERARGRFPEGAKLTCVLSVSVTHRGLQEVARGYVEETLNRAGGLEGLEVVVFTEADARQIVDEVLAPAAGRYLRRSEAKELLDVFGVDGAYGRHYSFLKAVAAFWAVFIRPEVRATFKIDLDQVFPQKELLEQTGSSAFEHFTTPLWGARGIDADGGPVELGMIAGALVNERDLARSLFTPDVPFPDRPLAPDEYVFFSALPQALSTEAEMMARYTAEGLDGRTTCLQRIHVTGGTNGILVDSLRRLRPFTPSFFGRAEDQAYLLSVFAHPGPRLAYLHKDGLIMRHDKGAFARAAIRSAQVGVLIGDYLRLIYFSAYARALSGDLEKLKETLDPFTGCFVTRIPTTVAYLRFGLKADSFFAAGEGTRGVEFITVGAKRIRAALDFVSGERSPFERGVERERLGWALYYEVLSAVERAAAGGDGFALRLIGKAKAIVGGCAIRLA